jgi:hypothetical protein
MLNSYFKKSFVADYTYASLSLPCCAHIAAAFAASPPAVARVPQLQERGDLYDL